MSELEEFVDLLFKNTDGIVYAPTKQGKRWRQKFFEYPRQKEGLLEHLTSNPDKDTYLSPALFSTARIHPTTFKGSYFLYSEFDGNAPADPELEPTVRIQSGFAGYEHFYWELDTFITDPEELKYMTKRLTYYFDADLSGWDYQQVLRPPGSRNHKRQMTAKLLNKTDVVYSPVSFRSLPDPPTTIDVKIDKSKLPPLQGLMMKYRWPEDAADLLTKSVDELGSTAVSNWEHDRSAAMARLGLHCAEMGMSNDEIYVVLDEVDRRWGKFTGRTDRELRLDGLISYVRTKKAIQADVVDETVVYRFQDFLETSINIKWVIDGLLPVAGSSVVYGPSGIGKSTFVLRMGIAIATGAEEFLGWPIERKQKVMFVSLEMPHSELKYFIQQMDLSQQTLSQLQDNFFIWPIGHPYPFDTRDQQSEILRFVDQFEIDLMIIDSLGESSYGSISSQDDMKRLYSFLNEDLRKDRNCGYMFVHHPRKPSGDQKDTVNYDDAYGDTYIINRAQTVIKLTAPRPGRIKIDVPKSRLSLEQASFYVKRQQDRNFIREEVQKEQKKEPPGLLLFGKKEVDAPDRGDESSSK